jgi:flagellar export protein FliJ
MPSASFVWRSWPKRYEHVSQSALTREIQARRPGSEGASMAVKPVLHRLLRLRELEEELSRVELETAVGNRNRVADELATAVERQARNRRSFAASAGERDTASRAGSVIAMEHARKLLSRIEPRLDATEREVIRQREAFLSKRTARQQVETLLEREQSAAREESSRRAQQMLDDWYGRRSPKQAQPPQSDASANPNLAGVEAKVDILRS